MIEGIVITVIAVAVIYFIITIIVKMEDNE
jgi:hypothetical protein